MSAFFSLVNFKKQLTSMETAYEYGNDNLQKLMELFSKPVKVTAPSLRKSI